MFQPRIVRNDDALLVFETLAFLIRHYGPPARPAVPSPLHKRPGIETLVYDDLDQREVFDWAQDSYATVCDVMHINPDEFRFIASVEDEGAPHFPSTHLPNLLSYDPRHCSQRGYFVAHLVLEICDRKLSAFNPGFEPSDFQAAIILLSAAAYFRQGFVLTHCLAATAQALGTVKRPHRFLENTLCFAACTALAINRQSPEQIVATYGAILPKAVRKKVPITYRQIESFETELKLLRIMSEGQPARQRGRIRPELQSAFRPQPQRISWT
jgi:hypothetical protein